MNQYEQTIAILGACTLLLAFLVHLYKIWVFSSIKNTIKVFKKYQIKDRLDYYPALNLNIAYMYLLSFTVVVSLGIAFFYVLPCVLQTRKRYKNTKKFFDDFKQSLKDFPVNPPLPNKGFAYLIKPIENFADALSKVFIFTDNSKNYYICRFNNETKNVYSCNLSVSYEYAQYVITCDNKIKSNSKVFIEYNCEHFYINQYVIYDNQLSRIIYMNDNDDTCSLLLLSDNSTVDNIKIYNINACKLQLFPDLKLLQKKVYYVLPGLRFHIDGGSLLH